MTTNVTNGVIQLSGTVTRDDLIALDTGASGSPVTVTDHIAVKLNMPVSVERGTVLQLQGLVILVNNQSIGYAVLASDEIPPVFEGVTFVYNIRSHWSAMDLAVKNCVVVCDEGTGIFSVTSADNLILQSNISGSTPGGELFFSGGGIFRKIDFYSTGRLGIGGNDSDVSCFWLKNMTYHGQAPIRIGYNHAPSSIWEDFTAPNAPSGTAGWDYIDTYNASKNPHTIMLLGESVETFYRGGTGFNVGNRHENTKILTGGIKYWKVEGGGPDARLKVYDSRSENDNWRPVKSIPALTTGDGVTPNWELLNVNTSNYIPTDSGKITFIVTTGHKSDNTQTTQLEAVTDQFVTIVEYGKIPYIRHYSSASDAQLTEGSEDAPNTIILEEDVNITEIDTDAFENYNDISNLAQIYDITHAIKCEYPMLGGFDNRIFYVQGTSLVIADGWTLKRDQTISDLITPHPVNKEILVRTDGISRTDKFDSVIGSVDSSMDGYLHVNYLRQDGKVAVTISVTENANIQNPVIGVWPRADGFVNRTNIITAVVTNGTATLTGLEPETDYYSVIDGVGAYRQDSEFNTGKYGVSPSPHTLDQITHVDGSSLLPATLTTQQRRIANMFTFNPVTNHTDINLPDDYASDDRWDADNSIWTFTEDDFIAIAYRIEEIQSAVMSLAVSNTIRIEPFKLTLQSDSMFTLSQAAGNADAILNMNAFTITREGDDTQLKTYLDHTNGVIHTNAGNPVVATISTPISILQAVTDQIPVKVNEATDIQAIKVHAERLTQVRAEVLDSLAAMITNHQYTGDALANAPVGSSGGGETVSVDAQAIANAVWSAAVRTLTDSDGRELINTQPDLRTVIEENALTVEEIVTGIMDAPYGERPDGTPYLFNTLGEHLWHFYPPEIIRQLLETTLNGITQATRAQPQPGVYGSGTLGDAIREVLTRAPQETAAEARDHALAANVQTQEE